MTHPLRDPDDLVRENDKDNNNYHDEDLDIRNDEAPAQRGNRSVPHRPAARRPPPRRRYYED